MLFYIIVSIIIVVLLAISLPLYYRCVKVKKRVGEVIFINSSLLCFILELVNRVAKKHFMAITNPLNNRVHIVLLADFNRIDENDPLYKHEYVHVLQVRKYNRFIFLIKYLFYSIRYGYFKNPLEVEAYELENKSIEEIKGHFGL